MENNCHIKLTHIYYCKVLVNEPTDVSVVSISRLIPCYSVFWQSNSGSADQGNLDGCCRAIPCFQVPTIGFCPKL